MIFQQYFEEIGVHFILLLIFVILLIAFSINYYYNMRGKWIFDENDFAWRFPVEQITTLKYNVLLDEHVHTNVTGGILSLRQNVRWHIANGFNAMIITEHNRLNRSEKIAEVAAEFAGKFILIQGMEWTTERVHINFIDIKEWNSPIPKYPTDSEIQQAFKEAHDQGALVVVNHPWSQRPKAVDFPTFEQFQSWGADFIEVEGQGYYDLDAAKFCNDSGLGQITGSDIHFPIQVDGWTALNVESFTKEEIMNQLRSKNTQIIYYEKGTPDFSTRLIPQKYQKMAVFIAIAKAFCVVSRSQIEIKWKEILRFLAYLLIPFIMIELFWLLIITNIH
jgi:predicted metal-dependent phosphoesterase TrpH